MKNKYEEILVNGKRYLKHCYVWEQHNGKIPDGYEVHHKDLNTHNVVLLVCIERIEEMEDKNE